MLTKCVYLVGGYRAVTSATYEIRENSASGKHLVSEAYRWKAKTEGAEGHITRRTQRGLPVIPPRKTPEFEHSLIEPH